MLFANAGFVRGFDSYDEVTDEQRIETPGWAAEVVDRGIDWLKKYPPIKGKIKSIKTAILWKKSQSTFNPDFCAVELKSNPWIVQPFEKYEEIRVSELKEKHKK